MLNITLHLQRYHIMLVTSDNIHENVQGVVAVQIKIYI